ncbi:MAG: glycosyltransferase family 2 protein [Acidobacteriota bacterium]
MPGLLSEVTPVILTGDEETNIARTLGQLGWAREVIVVDSESTDRTRAIAESFANVRFVTRRFDDLASQWSHAVSLVTTAWVLTLDADYFVPSEAAAEIDALEPDLNGYEAEFVYAVGGKPLRASFYTARAVLLRRGAFDFYMDGHTQRVRVAGRVGRLRARLIHDDRKDLRRFVARQRRYMRDEAAKLRATPWRALNLTGRVRKLRVVAPFAVALHTLFVKGAILDGRAGWRYALERFLAEVILSRELMRS